MFNINFPIVCNMYDTYVLLFMLRMYMYVGPQSSLHNITVNRTDNTDARMDVGIDFIITFDVCNIGLCIY